MKAMVSSWSIESNARFGGKKMDPGFIQKVLLLIWALLNSPLLAYGADETLVKDFLAKRQTLVMEGRVDMGEMSKAIRAAIDDVARLESEAKYELAQERLRDLQQFSQLPDLPSYDVQIFLSRLYMKTGNKRLASMHRARADAMREVLLNRVGNGKSPETPIHVVMVSDLIEWFSIQSAKISNLKAVAFKGHELMAVTYGGPATRDTPALAYFEIDPRVQAKENSKLSLLSPIPLEQMTPGHRNLLEQARAKREAFLNDSKIPYLKLMAKVNSALDKAAKLDAGGMPIQALSGLREVETIRPIEDIPLASLIGMYSALNGKVGNNEKQNELRGLLFGIHQAIAHSGDGLSPETAVHVIAIQEEYDWLYDKRLTRVLQKLVDTPLGKFDVLTARNNAGERRDYYFNITRMYAMYNQGFWENNGK
jgi:hypothetical protein